jgi:hypothetical protein
MKLEIKPLLKRIQPLINFAQKDSVGIFLAIVAVVFGFLIWRIGTLAGAEPGQDAIDEKLTSVVRPKIDQDSIAKIKALQAQNVDLKSYFIDRSNQFQE